jgi:hypothetical protein
MGWYGESSPAFLNEGQLVESSAVRPVRLAVAGAESSSAPQGERDQEEERLGWDKLYEDVEVH